MRKPIVLTGIVTIVAFYLGVAADLSSLSRDVVSVVRSVGNGGDDEEHKLAGPTPAADAGAQSEAAPDAVPSPREMAPTEAAVEVSDLGQDEANEVEGAARAPQGPAVDSDQSIADSYIEVNANSSQKVGPNQYRAGRSPGFEPFVFTATRRLDRSDGCYVSWTVVNNDQVVARGNSACMKRGGFSEAYWPSSTILEPGTLRVTASITTDWGASDVAELTASIV